MVYPWQWDWLSFCVGMSPIFIKDTSAGWGAFTVSWPCLCVSLFPPESLQAVFWNHLCNSAYYNSPCIFCHYMRQLKTHLMLFTWFPELRPVYCPLLPSPLANTHTVLLCYRRVGASPRVPGPQLSSRLLQFHRAEVLGRALAKTIFPIHSNMTEASLATHFFSFHKHNYHLYQ